ncbi:MAG: NADPH-dependent F420 reductase [Anaerolineae bacterium]
MMRIGIIGSGNIGSILARHWVKAGYEVILSSRHPEKLKALAKSLGAKASVGTPEEAAHLGEVILLSIPLIEVLNLSQEVKDSLRGKIVMDTCNPYPYRDGDAGIEALNEPAGSGVWTARHLPGAKLIKAFNTVYFKLLETEAHRKGEPIGIPLASDDKDALQIVSKLVEDAGFGPVIIGELRRAKEFDNGTSPYASGASASELQVMFGKKRKTA